MKFFILTILFISTLSASWLDFFYEKNAKDAYMKNDYKQSINELQKLSNSDKKKYNLANSYYKDGQYQKAIDSYLQINNLDKATIYHNFGNSYFKDNRLDDAIRSYEKALNIRFDKDTKFNLDLAKKQKENKNKQKKEQKKEEDKKQDKKENQNKNKKQNSDNPKDKNGTQSKSQEKKNQQPKISQEQKEMGNILRKLEEKKMPTMMYQFQKTQRSNSDKNPW